MTPTIAPYTAPDPEDEALLLSLCVAEVGAALGCFDGIPVVGDSVGHAVVGIVVGRGEGATEGLTLGKQVGHVEGGCVGCTDGTDVGTFVGIVLGTRLGRVVGVAVDAASVLNIPLTKVFIATKSTPYSSLATAVHESADNAVGTTVKFAAVQKAP
jgi:hypothetical protein